MASLNNTSGLKRTCDYYELGAPLFKTEIEGGDVNTNYLVKTIKGDYVLRVIGKRLTPRKRKLLELEFKVITGLSRSSFSYQLPLPIKNSDNLFIDENVEKPYWVYPFLEGKSKGNKNTKLKEIAMALSKYHTSVSQIEIPLSQNNFFVSSWLDKKYVEMSNLYPKSRLDEKMKSHLALFDGILKGLSKITYNGNQLPTHGDFTEDNLLFYSSGEIKGIIDFDDIEVAPRIKDIANSILYTCYDGANFNNLKYHDFLSFYERNISLNKKEKSLIFPAILKELCSCFSWYFEVNKKQLKNSFDGIEETSKKAKSLLTNF